VRAEVGAREQREVQTFLNTESGKLRAQTEWTSAAKDKNRVRKQRPME